MCWSLEVSLAFASAELIALAFIAWRCATQAHASPAIASQRYWLPAMVSIASIELLEVLLWAEGDSLTPITEAVHATCTARNARLTRALGLLIYWQPLAFIWACQHGGDPSNRERLLAPQWMAVAMGVACLVALGLGERAGVEVHDAALSHFRSFASRRTCTYIGRHGHLHWTFRMAAGHLLPNTFSYLLLTSTCVLARPAAIRVVVSLYLLAYIGCLAALDWSFEASSVWCWSAIVIYAAFIVQPYVATGGAAGGAAGAGVRADALERGASASAAKWMPPAAAVSSSPTSLY